MRLLCAWLMIFPWITKMRLALFALCLISRMYLCLAASLKCKPYELPVNGHALKDHTFQTSVVQDPTECQVLCENVLTCQSYNYFTPGKICELNNRTKEARPDSFVPDDDRFYVKNWPNRVPLGSIHQMPAESCLEIDASEKGRAASGSYWLKINQSEPFQVYCDMTTGSKGWILIARFSNNDALHWMNDSGYWWYDKTEASGKTTDPSTNADMISPAFWLTSGHELKITRSDDSQHMPLLQTVSDCLGGQTFRSKMTSYGDFRNGAVGASEDCMGNCIVRYAGQYQETTGFQWATCNGTIQSFNYVGFWCRWLWSGSVLMIGGAGDECEMAGHGIGVTTSKTNYFVTTGGRPENDVSSYRWNRNPSKDYALNLWIRGQHK